MYATYNDVLYFVMLLRNQKKCTYCKIFLTNMLKVIAVTYTQGCHRYEPKNKDNRKTQ